MNLISSSQHARMHGTDASEAACARSLQAACMDSLVRAWASARRAAGVRMRCARAVANAWQRADH
eukprot:2697097-Pleurochrysis_carterae.AAC.4